MRRNSWSSLRPGNKIRRLEGVKMKTAFIFFELIFFAMLSHAADFTPTPMTIKVPAQIEYKFNGASLEIPFTLNGKSGAFWLVIDTHGQSENIKAVRNGYLGWHYVNKIDTTIYISQKFERTPGENTIVWDGKDENGNQAEPGEYDYYLWGYDDKSSRELVCKFIQIGYYYDSPACKIYEKGSDGLPLSKPWIMGCQSYWWSEDNEELYKRPGINFKWIIGSTPDDVSLLQTTSCSMYYPKKYLKDDDYLAYSCSVFNPVDYNVFYHTCYKNIQMESSEWGKYNKAFSTLLKWKFVPSGEAIIDNEWFGWDKAKWEEVDYGLAEYTTCFNDNNYIYLASPGRTAYKEWNRIRCVNYDGEQIFDKTLHEWYMPSGIYRNNSIEKMYSRFSNKWLVASTASCILGMINTSKLVEDADDETDMIIFQNSNGDYFLDSYWQQNIDNPWFCVPESVVNDYKCTLKDFICIDSNNLNIIFVSNYGISSFGVCTQDGTGIGYMNFADDSSQPSLGIKGGGQICDNGSAYDGLYIHGATDPQNHWTKHSQTYYIAFDSARGLITKSTAVEEKNPIQFKVNQNTPNPFNPSTTISFRLPEKVNVSVDIYNVAGQKVKTLVNGYISAGEHSVRWNASGCSAGVYFYKVKAGKYERTMKMTLVR